MSPKLEQYSLYCHVIAEWSGGIEVSATEQYCRFEMRRRGQGRSRERRKLQTKHGCHKCWYTAQLCKRTGGRLSTREPCHLREVKASRPRLRTSVAQSRDCVSALRNLEIGTQFQDSENAQRNLEIAQIPKLRGTYTQCKLTELI